MLSWIPANWAAVWVTRAGTAWTANAFGSNYSICQKHPITALGGTESSHFSAVLVAPCLLPSIKTSKKNWLDSNALFLCFCPKDSTFKQGKTRALSCPGTWQWDWIIMTYWYWAGPRKPWKILVSRVKHSWAIGSALCLPHRTKGILSQIELCLNEPKTWFYIG